MFRTDDPVADFLRHDAEQQRRLNKLPKCCMCDENIQTEELYDIDGDLICPDCLEHFYRKQVTDYIE